MPLYSVAATCAMYPGDEKALFDAEVVATGNASIAIARSSIPGAGTKNITFDFAFATAPTAAVAIQVAMVDADANYHTVYASTNLVADSYTDAGNSAFYRFKITSYSAGGVFTGIVRA